MNENMYRPSWIAQFSALSVKNARVIVKKPLMLIATLIMPALGFLLVGLIMATQSQSNVKDDSTKAAVFTSGVPLKLSENSIIYFTPNIEPFTGIMKTLAAQSKLNFGSNILGFQNPDDVSSAIFSNFDVLRKADFWTVVQYDTTSAANQTSYTIWTEKINSRNDYYGSLDHLDDLDLRYRDKVSFNKNPLALQIALDTAIISQDSNTNGNAGAGSMDYTLDWFTPLGSDADTLAATSDNFAIKQNFASLIILPILALSFIPLMVFVLDIISKEKQDKLLGALRRMGLIDSTFWLSLSLPMAILALLSAFISAIAAKAISGNVPLFQNVSFTVIVVINFSYSLSLVGFGFFWASFISRPVFVNTLTGLHSLSTAIVSLVLFLDVSSLTGMYAPLTAMWFSKCQSIVAKILLFLLAPYFGFCRAWTDVQWVTTPSLWNNDTATFFDIKQFVSTPRPFLLTEEVTDEIITYKNLESTSSTCLLLILSFFVFYVMAWYLNQVIPSVEGFARPWYFLFSSAYWTGRETVKNVTGEKDKLLEEKEVSGKTNSVRIIKLTKQYAGNTAVKEFSSTFENGKVYAILGHNGAGKTTLINMLSLVTSPTFGECYMFGMDIKEDTVKLQGLMSLCPQFDILYPSLTAYQHMHMYLRFRGEYKSATKAELNKVIMQKLASVDLDVVAHKAAHTFSGGMKRRLSLILSTLSLTSRIVFLDEPTTGLDPISRRKSWKVIQELKKNRVVVLTTHSMEEADSLGDHICIMHQGRLRASGSSIFLKNRFGKGYQVSVVPRSKKEALVHQTQPNADASQPSSTLEAYINYALPGSEIVSSAAGAITVAVNKQAGHQMSQFLKALKSDSTMDWSISNSTLEEVFLKLCADNKAVATDEEGGSSGPKRLCQICNVRPTDIVSLYTRLGLKVTIPDFVCRPCADGENTSEDHTHENGRHTNSSENLISFAEFAAKLNASEIGTALLKNHNKQNEVRKVPKATGMALFGKQVNSIIIKNARLHVKEVKTNICFAILIAIICFVASMVSKSFDNFKQLKSFPQKCDKAVMQDQGFPPKYNCDARSLSLKLKPLSACRMKGIQDCAGDGSLVAFDGLNTASFSTFGGLGSSNRKNSIMTFDSSFDLSSFLPESFRIVYTQTAGSTDQTLDELLPKSLFNLPPDANSSQPIFYKFPSGNTVNNGLSDIQNNLRKSETALNKCSGFGNKVGIEIASKDDFFKRMAASYPNFGIDISKLSFSKTGFNLAVKLNSYPSIQQPSPFVPLYLSDTSILPSYMQSSCIRFDPNPFSYKSLNYKSSFNSMVMINGMSNALMQNVAANPKQIVVKRKMLPLFITKEDLKSNPLNRIIFSLEIAFLLWTTGILYPRIIQLLVVEKKESLVEMMRIQGLGLFRYWIGNYIYGFIMIFSVSVLYSILSVLAGFTTGTFSVFLALLVWIHGQVCMSIFIASIMSQPLQAALTAYMLYLMTGVMSIFLIQALAASSGALSFAFWLFPPTGIISLVSTMLTSGDIGLVLSNALVTLFASSVLGLLGCYIHAIRPSPVGIAVDPLLGLGDYFRSGDGMIQADKNVDVEKSHRSKLDIDVIQEERRVLDLHQKNVADPNEAIRLVNLRKTFGAKVAVDSISLSIFNGETFGLLGPNGAGKTTTLSMLTGLLKRSGGAVSIAGRSIDDAMASRGGSDGLWRYIGVTPQFDTVWPNLTVEEHLYFYCRLHGVPKQSLGNMARRIAEEVELDGDAYRQVASGLSGGMKRRLSIGIALTAEPRILVLDEPTTGLDPETKRQVWRVVDRVKKSDPDRCVIITTHSMEEADALCSRIGIVCDGNLKVLGSQVHLKNKFGEGLKLTMRFNISIPFQSGLRLDHCKTQQDRRLSELNNHIMRGLGLRSSRNHMQLLSSDMGIAFSNAAAMAQSFGPEISWLVTAQFMIPREQVDISDVFMNLEQACKDAGLSDWTINETTLEDVFVRVAEFF